MVIARGHLSSILTSAVFLVLTTACAPQFTNPYSSAPAGTPDPSWNGVGLSEALFAVGSVSLSGIALRPDGSVVASGTFPESASKSRVALARFTAAGAVDPSFGTAGTTTLTPAGFDGGA